jgi:hypothetical protein
VLFGVVGMGVDNLCGRFAGDGVVEAVLYHSIELLGCGRLSVVIDAAFGIYVGYLLPDATFAGTDGAYSLEQFTEIVCSENSSALL